MSIASEITRINTNIANAYTACNNKGATIPQTQNSANLATAISSISTGITPSGNITFTQNGTYDVTDKSSAVVNIPAFTVTNLVPGSLEADGTPYNNGLGYKTGYSLSTTIGSPSAEISKSARAVTGFIPASRYDYIRVINMGVTDGNPIGIWIFDSNKNLLNDKVAYIRVVCAADAAANLIVTKNERISPLEV